MVRGCQIGNFYSLGHLCGGRDVGKLEFSQQKYHLSLLYGAVERVYGGEIRSQSLGGIDQGKRCAICGDYDPASRWGCLVEYAAIDSEYALEFGCQRAIETAKTFAVECEIAIECGGAISGQARCDRSVRGGTSRRRVEVWRVLFVVGLVAQRLSGFFQRSGQV